MLKFGSLLKVARQCKFSTVSFSSHSFTEHGNPLGEQRAYYKVDLRKQLRKGNDTRFEFDDYEKEASRIPGFGGWNKRPQVSGYGGRRRTDSIAGGSLKPKNFGLLKDLAPINRGYYVPHENVAQRPQAEIDEFLSKHEMTLEGNDIPRPILTFDETTFDEKMLNILRSKYEKPTSIQSISWPVALSGRDLISIARTGSGKTLCFLLPGLVHAIHQTQRGPAECNAPNVLVMVPTRELAQQVEEVAREYCRAMRLRLVCLFGGASKNVQASHLANGVDVCVSTPGRLLDFLEANAINLERCSYLVLDEADRMLDMGFEPQIRKVVSQIRPDRQTLMFSATWPPEIRTLAADFQKEPVFLNVGSLELSANHNITQNVTVLPHSDEKLRHLHTLLDGIAKEPEFKALIFVETKRKVDFLTASLRRRGLSALAIHGDKSQSERNWVLKQFRSGEAKVLLATDVAARGLVSTAISHIFSDVDDIKHVINYDFPNSSEDYVHRIGRTGRRDNKGTSHTFITDEDAHKVGDLIRVLKEANQPVSDELYALTNHSGGNSKHQWRGLRAPVGRGAGGSFSKFGRPVNSNRDMYNNVPYKQRSNF